MSWTRLGIATGSALAAMYHFWYVTLPLSVIIVILLSICTPATIDFYYWLVGTWIVMWGTLAAIIYKSLAPV